MVDRSTAIDSVTEEGIGAPSVTRRRILFAVPALGFAGLSTALVWGLGRDPSEVPSPLINRRVPSFSLPPVQGATLGFSSANLLGRVSLVNVFASWCVACRAEHPQLMWLSRQKLVPLFGIDYKDPPEDAAKWLQSNGDPYSRVGADRAGRVAIDWGVYGVPETYVVGPNGIIAHKHIGPVLKNDLEDSILPLVRRLQAAGGARS